MCEGLAGETDNRNVSPSLKCRLEERSRDPQPVPAEGAAPEATGGEEAADAGGEGEGERAEAPGEKEEEESARTAERRPETDERVREKGFELFIVYE